MLRKKIENTGEKKLRAYSVVITVCIRTGECVKDRDKGTTYVFIASCFQEFISKKLSKSKNQLCHVPHNIPLVLGLLLHVISLFKMG